MRANVSIAIVVVAFLLRSTGMVRAFPPPVLLAQGTMRPAKSVAPLTRMPFSRQRDSSKGAKEIVLHSFEGGADGASPYCGLVYANDVGVFYGTTAYGGTYNEGTVFELTTAGTENVLYSFAGGTDGARPFAGLAYTNGVLYGTTSAGGTHNDGTVFKVTAGGAESVLYSFAGAPDGAAPWGGLVLENGKLYGTTLDGGKYKLEGHNSGGTVFEVTAAGGEKVLHSFGSKGDGAKPHAGLVYADGVFYGTTEFGGGKYDGGAVFEITPGGAESVLHAFNNVKDGYDPVASLIYVKGNLYGTTAGGGTHNDGTVFEITAGGTERVLHSFRGDPDGLSPYTGLVYANGNLYGTTDGGGKYEYGTAFEVTAGGTEDVLHSFAGGTDGGAPLGVLVYMNGNLYGTTPAGGGSSNDGTVFELTP